MVRIYNNIDIFHKVTNMTSAIVPLVALFVDFSTQFFQ